MMPEPGPGRILVTGASSGIGLGVCQRLLERGYRVIGLSRSIRQDALAGENFEAIPCDLRDVQATQRTLKAILKSTPDISAAVCCAGAGYFATLEQLDFRKIQELLDLNLLSPMLISKLLIPGFKRRGTGRLVFIGSEAALQGSKNGSAYCASKFGLRGFVQSLSAECRQAGVNVSLINPGMVDTPFFDDLHFRPGDDPSNHIPLETVVDCVDSVLHADPNANIEEINLMPRNRVISFK